jgi:hypothetical protein
MLFSDFVFVKFNRVLIAVEYEKKDKFQTLLETRHTNNGVHEVSVEVSVVVLVIIIVVNIRRSMDCNIDPLVFLI